MVTLLKEAIHRREVGQAQDEAQNDLVQKVGRCWEQACGLGGE